VRLWFDWPEIVRDYFIHDVRNTRNERGDIRVGVASEDFRLNTLLS
jgi:hypothetical protein